jgi:hypothetical protein
MKKKLLLIIFLSLTFLTSLSLLVSAQSQTTPFSGNDPASWQCFNLDGSESSVEPKKDPSTGNFMCRGVSDGKTGTVDVRAVMRPVTLQQLEIWFVKIVYAIWALVASISFLLLVYLGYQYMLKRGTSDQALVDLRKRILYYAIGFCLVFLAVPILTTVFRLMGINESVRCYDVLNSDVGVGFKFFFPSLCTTPTLIQDPCSMGTSATGYACADFGKKTGTCQVSGTSASYYYTCDSGIWQLHLNNL